MFKLLFLFTCSYFVPSKKSKTYNVSTRAFTYAIRFFFRVGLKDHFKCLLCKPVIASLADHMLSVHDILGPFYSPVADDFSKHIAFSEKITLYRRHHNRSSVYSVALQKKSVSFALWLLKTKNLIHLKKRGLLCFSRVSVLCACVRIPLLEKVTITVIQSLCYLVQVIRVRSCK